MNENKLYIEISAGEESYYFTLEEGQRLMAEEFKRISAEGKDFDGCPYEWDFKWMTEEEFEELTGNPDRPVWLTPPPESQPVKGNEDILVKAVERLISAVEDKPNVYGYPNEIKAVRDALSSYRTSVKGEDQDMETYQEIIKLVRRLESEYSSIYDSAAYIKTHFTVIKKPQS